MGPSPLPCLRREAQIPSTHWAPKSRLPTMSKSPSWEGSIRNMSPSPHWVCQECTTYEIGPLGLLPNMLPFTTS